VLGIFATRARTAEAKLQVELAQLEYALPRLKNMWNHLSRQVGGGVGVGMSGPGEKQLELDRRLATDRIRALKRRIAAGQPARSGRCAAGRRAHVCRWSGTPNAGKSRLMNALTGPGSTSRTGCSRRSTPAPQVAGRRGAARAAVGHGRVRPRPAAPPRGVVQGDAGGGPPGRPAVARGGRQQPARGGHVAAVEAVLAELGVRRQPTVLVLTRSTRSPTGGARHPLGPAPAAVAVSALTGEGLDALADAVRAALGRRSPTPRSGSTPRTARRWRS
jgi:GTP-binding protein HflX